jgi:hypothetical protein
VCVLHFTIRTIERSAESQLARPNARHEAITLSFFAFANRRSLQTLQPPCIILI